MDTLDAGRTETARKWLMQALHDLDMSEKNVGIAGYDVASFLAHQAVEKLLKSLISLAGKPVPRTHYLDELAERTEAPDEVRTIADGMAEDYVFARYPDVSEEVPYEQYDEAIARERVRGARRVFELLRERYSPLLRRQDNG
jgi:HEPN domain-containing protein